VQLDDKITRRARELQNKLGRPCDGAFNGSTQAGSTFGWPRQAGKTKSEIWGQKNK